jgi:hypothetical protein
MLVPRCANALVSVLLALLIAGCDNERTDFDRPEPAPPPPCDKKSRKVAAPNETSASDSTTAAKKENKEDPNAQLKREIEDLRRRLKALPKESSSGTRYGPNATVSRRTIVETLARTKKDLDALNAGYVSLLQCSTEQLVDRRTALGPARFDDCDWRRIEIRRLLLMRLDLQMSRDEVRRILGEPELSDGDSDYYSQYCCRDALDFGPLDLSLAFKRVPVDWSKRGSYYRIRYSYGHFNAVTPPARKIWTYGDGYYLDLHN